MIIKRINEKKIILLIISASILFCALVGAVILLSVRLSNQNKKLDELSAAQQSKDPSNETKSTEEIISDNRYEILVEDEAKIKSDLLQKNYEFEDLIKNSKLGNVDVSAIDDLTKELTSYLQSGAPIAEEDRISPIPTGETVTVKKGDYPKVALYYQNLRTGYSYSYNADMSFYAASCVKMPLAYSIFLNADAEERAIELSLAQGEITNKDSITRTFDFNKKYTYKIADFTEGTGEIKNSVEGTEYTYYQLLEYMIKYSDTIAMSQILSEWGYDYLHPIINQIDATTMKESLWNMSASDGGKVLEQVYAYITGSGVYAQSFKEMLINSDYPNIIPNALPTKQVAHKYGWDYGAYHDMGIVFDDDPYIVVFLSNMDTGSDKDSAFARNVIAYCDKLNSLLTEQ